MWAYVNAHIVVYVSTHLCLCVCVRVSLSMCLCVCVLGLVGSVLKALKCGK